MNTIIFPGQGSQKAGMASEFHSNFKIVKDILYRGNLDIINGNWDGYHRLFVKRENFFEDIATSPFNTPSKIRTVISADFDNDGFDEVFMNNIGEPNKLFKILDNGKVK